MNVFEAVEECKNILKLNIVGSIKALTIDKITKNEEGYFIWYSNSSSLVKNCVVIEVESPCLEFLFQVQVLMKDFVQQQEQALKEKEKELVWVPVPGYSRYSMTESNPTRIKNNRKGTDMTPQKTGLVYRVGLISDSSYKVRNERLDELHRLTFPHL